MTTFPTFDEYYRPKLQTHLNQNVVDFMEKKVDEVEQINNADEAEKLLDQACDECVNRVKVQMEEIKASVKQKGANCTTSEDKQKYKLFVEGVTAGIQSTQGLFDKIVEHIRIIIKTVVNLIKDGFCWTIKIITDAFNNIRSFLNN